MWGQSPQQGPDAEPQIRGQAGNKAPWCWQLI